jgi:hypothetical protein
MTEVCSLGLWMLYVVLFCVYALHLGKFTAAWNGEWWNVERYRQVSLSFQVSLPSPRKFPDVDKREDKSYTLEQTARIVFESLQFAPKSKLHKMPKHSLNIYHTLRLRSLPNHSLEAEKVSDRHIAFIAKSIARQNIAMLLLQSSGCPAQIRLSGETPPRCVILMARWSASSIQTKADSPCLKAER